MVDVIGDVHGVYPFETKTQFGSADSMQIGEFYDMLDLYSLTGEPSEKHCLLMNGDLVIEDHGV